MIRLVTGTGTDVGKTIATAAIAACFHGHVHIVKPAQTGEPAGHGDAQRIADLTKVNSIHECARYPDPLAPLTAARHAGMQPLQLTETVKRIRAVDARPEDLVLVEGAGGLLVELGLTADDAPWTIADLARELNAPLYVVSTTGLGSLNHATLTLEAMKQRGLTCAGLVGGCVPQEPDLATRLNLEHFRRGLLPNFDAPWLGAIPAGAGQLSEEVFRTAATQWLSL